MIKYDKLWLTMQERGITKYTLHKEYHFSKSLIHRLQNNEGVSGAGHRAVADRVEESVADRLVAVLVVDDAESVAEERLLGQPGAPGVLRGFAHEVQFAVGRRAEHCR